jgi:hypothetical protein
MFFPRHRVLLVVLLFAAFADVGNAQTTPLVGWLRYTIPPDPPRYHDMPHTVILLGNGAGQAAPEEETAADELDRGLGHMVAGTDLLLHRFDPRVDAIVLGTTQALHRARIGRSLPAWVEKPLPEESFRIVHLRRGIRQWYILQGGSPRAELWAAFRFAALVAEDQQLPEELIETPHFAMRAMELDGDPSALPGVEALRERFGFYRLLASVGINALIVDGETSNAHGLAAAIQPFGMRLWFKVNAGETVQAAVATFGPNVAGLVVDVPNHATAEQMRDTLRDANALAKTLQHSGRAVLLRGALGAPLQSNGDKEPMTPHQRAAMLHEHLEPNIIVASDGVSPLLPLAGLGSANFGLLPGVSQAAEFDVLPVRSSDLAYPLAAWQRAVRTPERGLHGESPLSEVLGLPADGAHGGVVGRLSMTRAAELMQQPLLQANLYAFGRFAWSPTKEPAAVTEEWSRQTWGDDARVHAVASQILLGSAAAYTGNSSPFGMASLADMSGGPDPEKAAAKHGVGGVSLADSKGFGTDRTASGTGEVAAYPDSFAATLADPAKCPEEWLLAAQRLPYSTPVKGNKTAAQAFYDVHFAVAGNAANAMDAWEETRLLVDESRYAAVHAALEEAAHQAEIWRESTTEWLERVSGVRDALGFVGSHPGRVLSKEMQATGYAVAKGESELLCPQARCSSTTVFQGPANVYRVEVGYLRDVSTSSFELRVNGVVRARWQSQSALQQALLSTSAAQRFVANGIALKADDKIEVHATTNSGDRAPLQFVEITRDPRWN